MPRRTYSPLHDFWHPRVEGQIKHTIGQHPEWFKKECKADIVNSIAKRITGEIVAATRRGDDTEARETMLRLQASGVDVAYMSHPGVRRLVGIAAPLRICWHNAKVEMPPTGKNVPYLVVHCGQKRRRHVTIAIWCGPEIKWKFCAPSYQSASPEHVLYWAQYPKPPLYERYEYKIEKPQGETDGNNHHG